MNDETRNFLLRNQSERELIPMEDETLSESELAALLFQDSYESSSSDPWLFGGLKPLALRLSGKSVKTGKLTTTISDSIVKPVLRQLGLSVGGQSKNFTEYAVAQVLPGSLILHITPVEGYPNTELGLSEVSNSTPEIAFSNFLETIQYFEQQVDFERLKAKIVPIHNSLKHFVDLCNGIAKQNLVLQGLWLNQNGRLVNGSISTVGAAYAQEIFKQLETDEIRTISGLITSMNLNGEINLKLAHGETGTYKVSTNPDWIRGRDLRLGEFVTLKVRETQAKDRLDVRETSHFSLIEEIVDSKLF